MSAWVVAEERGGAAAFDSGTHPSKTLRMYLVARGRQERAYQCLSYDVERGVFGGERQAAANTLYSREMHLDAVRDKSHLKTSASVREVCNASVAA